MTIGLIMRLPVKQTLLLILVPMLATFAIQRLYLHVVGVQHIRASGLIIHHLFFGVATIIPAAFVLAFGARHRRSAILSRVALGIGSAMVLDENGVSHRDPGQRQRLHLFALVERGDDFYVHRHCPAPDPLPMVQAQRSLTPFS
jgi:hypothetical protein